MTHSSVEPGILYFGTPVVLLSTRNEDETANLAPMSSAFWLGWRGLLGLGAQSKTAQNLLRTGECVLNLPSDEQAGHVDRLALTTGSDPVPPRKAERGYEHEGDKFGRAGLTPVESDVVSPPRVAECPVNLEAVLEATHPIGSGSTLAFEVRILRVHAHDDILVPGTADHIDPDRWRPLIMSFQQFYGLGERVRPSRLASIPERMYRTPDIERARAAV
ncbi:flavin reductase (DIM6/NTAB) family NADH-FMN oxidoreductase RutF [Amycolatopsis bartoniae]|uniref:Flavin reductase n=1 Tax=Amycolatopsis bartoniae TaxID=941986 RepID=A0A8H9J124_9PSEU|nr:flavin reductase family protein [Amycolatopsis bartoniae]MBB2933763.1 flavin reductase (DIM6/NTAB) family NADH-FMN oxidoreductase RutF [Amycolatopsis bartoniae]TVT10575.1 flavin reductase family protein [Amycolatopsis bartoniae]GHF71896.1 flavin reductase [Amycolatopsis bartoniae]